MYSDDEQCNIQKSKLMITFILFEISAVCAHGFFLWTKSVFSLVAWKYFAVKWRARNSNKSIWLWPLQVRELAEYYEDHVWYPTVCCTRNSWNPRIGLLYKKSWYLEPGCHFVCLVSGIQTAHACVVQFEFCFCSLVRNLGDKSACLIWMRYFMCRLE
jgi:hypothetical protein